MAAGQAGRKQQAAAGADGGRGPRMCLEATEADVRRALDWLQQRLVRHGVCARMIEDIRIAAGEALNNVVEHAYGGMPGGPMCLDLRADSGQVVLMIEDCGRPIPAVEALGSSLPGAGPAPDDLPEGGFGWFLIRRLCRQVGYRREGGRNRLSLTFAVRNG